MPEDQNITPEEAIGPDVPQAMDGGEPVEVENTIDPAAAKLFDLPEAEIPAGEEDFVCAPEEGERIVRHDGTDVVAMCKISGRFRKYPAPGAI